ncbi:unnamed protein product [Phytophthora fragariaefolia]|uniref:Unnamed protein product n=1 Tax=Phytophthora fragariaefolia TaxID=1490495 RepID=A0A9W6YES5_9STRA|nr:unnamed protein product [Phytophthora fragariaefolia]
MSAEVWGDLIPSLCDAAQCYDPEMRYQYSLSDLRNKEWKAVLATTMVNSIPHAVAVLLFKNMHLPIDDDSEFAEDAASKLASENSMMQQMLTMMQQTQNLLVQQQQQQMARPPRSPRQTTAVAVAYYQPDLPEGRGTVNAVPYECEFDYYDVNLDGFYYYGNDAEYYDYEEREEDAMPNETAAYGPINHDYYDGNLETDACIQQAASVTAARDEESAPESDHDDSD